YRRPYRAISTDRTLIDVVPEAPTRNFGVAADIGTSTVVLRLVDLANGTVIASRSAMNAQKPYGADVISRIAHASQGPEHLARLQGRIVDQVQEMIGKMLSEVAGALEEVVLLVAAGNPTMLHLFAGISPEKMATAPFVPVFTDSLVFSAAEVGLQLHPRAEVRFLPSVAAYVGADIVAGIVATSMDRSEQPCLLVDLGTNCEMVLGGRTRMLACATAAGPAFEGAQIECGVGGVPGAIRRVWGNEEPLFETIGDLPPVGICGSGILDTVALLLSTGLADGTGRMSLSSANGLGAGFRARMSESGGDETRTPGSIRFLLTPPHAGLQRAQKGLETALPQEIFFTQKDLREVQLAKAAVAAGIEVLVERMGIAVGEIAAVYLAGSFGSALSAEAACRIGLLPELLRHRIIAVGNSSGRGALLALRSVADSRRCEEVRHRVEYIELSSDAKFRDAFIEEMAFPAERPSGAVQTKAEGA
ncbi:MAG TPA: ASKHA domain-containing protein, partial [Spirochaetia bacterium]|nr:ASKHA domain-containing protein [Spirochaetia bacterium]